MEIRILQKYIELSKKFNVAMSFEGLIKFKQEYTQRLGV